MVKAQEKVAKKKKRSRVQVESYYIYVNKDSIANKQSFSLTTPKMFFTEEASPFVFHAIFRIGVVHLPNGFTPSDKDVICGRAKKNYFHAGNEAFRQLVAANLRRYLAAKTRLDKGSVVQSIIDEVNSASPQGGFVRRDHRLGAWFVVEDATAREKVGATIRSMIRKAGGEDALLSELTELDKQELPSVASLRGDDTVSGWLRPDIVGAALQQPASTTSSPVEPYGGLSSPHESRECAHLKTTGLDITAAELGWLTEMTPQSEPSNDDQVEQKKASSVAEPSCDKEAGDQYTPSDESDDK